MTEEAVRSQGRSLWGEETTDNVRDLTKMFLFLVQKLPNGKPSVEAIPFYQ